MKDIAHRITHHKRVQFYVSGCLKVRILNLRKLSVDIPITTSCLKKKAHGTAILTRRKFSNSPPFFALLTVCMIPITTRIMTIIVTIIVTSIISTIISTIIAIIVAIIVAIIGSIIIAIILAIIIFTIYGNISRFDGTIEIPLFLRPFNSNIFYRSKVLLLGTRKSQLPTTTLPVNQQHKLH